jgi:hypothetical protein
MTRKATLVLAAAAAVVLAQSLAAQPSTVPQRLLVAQYVALGIDLGDRIVAAEELVTESSRATPRERAALAQIRQSLEGWGRYVVVNRRAEADLLLVVREGRRGSLGGSISVGVGTGVQPPPVGGANAAGAFASREDMLAVYDTKGGSPTTALWKTLTSSGLSGRVPLFEVLRSDVERAAAQRKRP